MNIKYENMMTTPVLIVAVHGHVWLAKGIEVGTDHMHLHHARIVRNWGTTKGLNQLVDGPTTDTVLDDPAPIMFLPDHAVIAVIPCRPEAWSGGKL
jgi:hypothetical protein